MRTGESLDRPSGRPGWPAGGVPAGGEPSLHEVLLASAPGPVLRSFRARLLRPLLDYDASHNAELLATLRSFLACDGSWSACASRMYLHVNTVRYRIGRVEELTGRDLSALPDRVDFFLALRGTDSGADGRTDSGTDSGTDGRADSGTDSGAEATAGTAAENGPLYSPFRPMTEA